MPHTSKNAYRGAYRLRLQDNSLKVKKPAKGGSKLAYQTYHKFKSYSNACYMHCIFPAVNPLPIVPLCTAYPQTFNFPIPVNRPQKQSIITSDALFFKVPFTCQLFITYLTRSIRGVNDKGRGA
jgi:hypothetical protein